MALVFETMVVGGLRVPSQALMDGFMAWSEVSPMAGHKALSAEIARAMGNPDLDLEGAADRLIQKLRKNGYITLEKRIWSLTDKGRNLRFNIEQSD